MPNESISIQISVPTMRLSKFERKAFDNKTVEGLNFNFVFAYSRPAIDGLGVEMTVESSDHQLVHFEVSWRADFHLIGNFESDTNYDDALKQLAGQTAPVVLYPYIREMVMSASQKAGIDPIVLPVINFGELIQFDELDIPSYVAPEEVPSEVKKSVKAKVKKPRSKKAKP